MKKLSILFILLLATLCLAGEPIMSGMGGVCTTGKCRSSKPIQLVRMPVVIVGGGTSAAAGCTTASDSKLAYPVTQPGVTAAITAHIALKITLGSTTTVTTYKVLICDDGADVGTVRVSLYNDDGNGATSKPTTEIANSNISLASSAFVNCNSTSIIDFDLASPLTGVAAGTYWIVNKEESSAVRKSWYQTSVGDRACYSNDGSTWTCVNDTEYDMELWGCQ